MCVLCHFVSLSARDLGQVFTSLRLGLLLYKTGGTVPVSGSCGEAVPKPTCAVHRRPEPEAHSLPFLFGNWFAFWFFVVIVVF